MLQERAAMIDLRQEPENRRFDWIAYGHYGPDAVKHLAEKIARVIESRD